MKKLFLIIYCVLMLGLCACGAKDVSESAGELLYRKYSVIIDMLEEGQYDSAISAIEKMMPSPEIVIVDLTLDNIWDYFELDEEISYSKDAQGNYSQAYVWHSIKLKPQYKKANEDTWTAVVGITYTRHYYNGARVDNFDDLSYSDWNKHNALPLSREIELLNQEIDYDEYGAMGVTINSNFDFIRAEGKIAIAGG